MISTLVMLRRTVRDELLDLPEFEPVIPMVPTSFEFLELRWWDGAYAPFVKIVMALFSAREPSIDREVLVLGARRCTSVRKVADLGIRYNEIVDLIHDIGVEPVNEIHVAARHGGIDAVLNYGNACAASLDQAAACVCDDSTHDWALELGIGYGCWYAIQPRYKAWPQLAQLLHFSAAKYKELIDNSQHGAFVTSRVAVLNREGTLWTDDWKPAFEMEEIPRYFSGECNHCKLIEAWVIGRCLFRDAKNRTNSVQLLRKHVQEHAHLSDSVAMPGFWREILHIIVGGELVESVLNEYCELVEAVWKRLRYATSVDCDLRFVLDSMVDTWLEIDKLLVKSHSLIVGNVVRRAVMGIISMQLERTDVALYQRTLEGAIAYTLIDTEE
jgi:hypothetical protein